jgi:hypothetical protein
VTSQNIDASTDDPSDRKAVDEAWRKHRERLKPPILFYRALEFTAAADAYVTVWGMRRDGYMVWFLLGRAFELALKAALIGNGFPSAQLRGKKFQKGHGLAEMVMEADKRGLMMVDDSLPDTAWAIEHLSKAYATKELEYQESGRASGPTPHLLRKLVHFAIHRAGLFALRAEVRERLLRDDPHRPGLTLAALERYEFPGKNQAA